MFSGILKVGKYRCGKIGMFIQISQTNIIPFVIIWLLLNGNWWTEWQTQCMYCAQCIVWVAYYNDYYFCWMN